MQEPLLNHVENPESGDSADDVSLFRGGLFYQIQVIVRLIDPDRWNVGRRVLIILTISWLPLVIITALVDRDQLIPLLTDYEVYSRVAIAIPVLLIGQLVMEDRFGVVAKHVRQARLLGGEELQKVKAALATIRRLRDTPISELIIVAFIFLDIAFIWNSRVASAPGWAVYRSGGVAHLRAAGWYYGLVSGPLYQLLLGLCFWKWLLWCLFLFRLSRTDLQLVATHPDGHGGLGFLGLSPVGFIPVAFALSSVIGGSWANDIRNNGARLKSFELSAVILVALMFIIALAPLSLFVLKLDVLRRTAMLRYGVLAQKHATRLEEKWFLRMSDPDDAQFTVTDVTALADFAISYRNIKQMRPFPADKSTLIGLALAIIAPLFPVVLAEFPFSVIIKGLLGAIKAVPM